MDAEQSTARIPLRAKDGGIRAYALVNVADFERINRYRWHLNRGGYAQRTEHVPGTGKTGRGKPGRTKVHLLARDIARARPDQEVDHVNRDKLDNRRCNLRLATRRVNVLRAPACAATTPRGTEGYPWTGVRTPKSSLRA